MPTCMLAVRSMSPSSDARRNGVPCVIGRSEVGVPGVEVRVEVQHRDGTVLRVHGTQERERDRVVAADHDEPARVLGEGPRAGLDLAHGLGDVERVGDDVAGIRHLLGAEREDVLRGVVGAEEARGLAHVRRTEAGAGPVAHAAVEGHADDRDVGATDLVEAGEARERGDAGEARHDARIDGAADAAARRHRE